MHLRQTAGARLAARWNSVSVFACFLKHVTKCSTVRDQPPATSHQPPATSHQPPATSHQPSDDTGHRTPDTGHRTPDAGRQTPDARCQTPRPDQTRALRYSVFDKCIWGFLHCLCNEIMDCCFFAKRYEFGCNFRDREGRKQLTPNIVPFSVSVLAVVTNKVETAMYELPHRQGHDSLGVDRGHHSPRRGHP